ncbi:transmembrane protein 151B-like [Amphiura filiformis]|uniref:transmembrane protein 151B-like n=1 Tax=Amphiura filiformis TaxID=82378 RepID=UPI003B20BF2A
MNNENPTTSLEQRPIRRSLCGALRDETHWKCLILTLLMYGSLAVVLWCKLTLVEVVAYTYKGMAVKLEDSPCEDGYMYIPIAFLVLLYLVYLVECWYSEIRIEIYYKEDTDTVYDRIRRIREAYPVVWWRAISYHYNRHTRQVTRYRHGDTYTTTQEYYERINTHSAAGAFDFTECGVKDVSKHLLCLEDYPITRVTFTKNFMFLNEEAEYDYLSQRARFFSENDGRDENMETREGLSLTDVEFTDEMVSYAFSNKLPWYFSLTVFWTLSLCLLSWPYRLIVSYKTALVDYQIEKLFGTNFASGMVTIDTWNGETMQLTRVSTADSDRSLESMIRGNRHVVPSYSEALLMDLANGNCRRPGQTPNGTLTTSRSFGASDGLLSNGRLTVNGRSGRTSSISSAHRLSATSPLLGGPLGAFGRAYRSIVGISQIPLKDRISTGTNGHVPSNMQLIPSATGSGSMHQLSNGNAKPIENGTTPNGITGGIRSSGAGIQSPNGDVRHTTSFTDETDVRTRKNSCSGDGQKIGPNKSRKRPTSLPLCLGNRMLGSGDRGSDGEHQRTVQSCLVVDSKGVRTVLCHQQGPHHHPPAARATAIPETPTAFSRANIPVTPGCSPPAYEVAIEMQVPSQESASNESHRGSRPKTASAASGVSTSGGPASTSGDQTSEGQTSGGQDESMNIETSL